MGSFKHPGPAQRPTGQSSAVSAERPTLGPGKAPPPAANQSFGIGERPVGGGAATVAHVPVVTPSSRPVGDSPPKLERTPLPPV